MLSLLTRFPGILTLLLNLYLIVYDIHGYQTVIVMFVLF